MPNLPRDWMGPYLSLLRLDPSSPLLAMPLEQLSHAYEEKYAGTQSFKRSRPREVRNVNLDFFSESSLSMSDLQDEAEAPPWASYLPRRAPTPKFTRMMRVRSYFVRKRVRDLTLTLETRDCLAIFAIVCLRLTLRKASEVLQAANLGPGYSVMSLGRAVQRFETNIVVIISEEVINYELGDEA